jgi:AcrR family transcriptional regulator
MTDTTGRDRPTRNTERTRAAILHAAGAAMATRGTAVSLSYIAQQAGISKGGLLHHFASREALFVALVDEANRWLREAVMSHLDLSENIPGKMLRAYVRALLSGDEKVAQYFTSAPTWAGIYAIPEVVTLARANETWWREQLGLDGVSENRIVLVRRAAEGLAAAIAYGESDREADAQARDLLLALASGEPLPE